MKKISIVLIMGAFILSGALFHSCKKEEGKELKSTENLMLKEMSDFDLPIYMGKTMLIGNAEIYIADQMIYVAVNLTDPGEWEVTEAHLYAGEGIPPTSAPGQFPYHWYMGEPYPIIFGIDISDWWDCEVFDWYFALHLALRMDTGELDDDGNIIYDNESAWLLPEEGGTNWLNPKHKPIGWGEYFLWEFDYVPVIDNLELLVSEDLENWSPVTDFEICLNDEIDYYYFDTYFDVNVPLEENYLNPFYLEPVDEILNPGFWSYWIDKGVVENATGWRAFMWDIINGELPMFYLKWDGDDYKLIDGLQYQLFLAGITGYTGNEPLRISGDYPHGTYGFSGFVKSDNCEGEEFTIELAVQCD